MLGKRWRYKAVLDAPYIFLSENNKQKYFLSSRNFYYWPVLNPGCISVRGPDQDPEGRIRADQGPARPMRAPQDEVGPRRTR